ncbi:MAG: Hsp20/alpha crystallin family protein [Tenericutes bacterium]|nr:Hsp20/alpha crystallin family protein [Mycoplasmatota bacterium]
MSLLPEKFYLDDFFEDFVPMPKMPKNEMKCDIYEKGGEVHIELDVPGFNKEDVKVDLDDGILTIAASKHEDKEEKEKNYYRKERSFGSFKRQFNVGNVKENDINAKFYNGVLKISFPKEEQKQSKKFIAIK